MKTKIVLATFALFLAIACTNTSKQKQQNAIRAISEMADSLVKENHIPGLNLSIIYNDGHQENYSSGYANPETKMKLIAEHVMFSGSIGKTYAVAVIMQLVDEGKIKLQDKFLNYFPDVEWLNLLPNMQDITIQMLLQHTTGLPRYIENTAVWDTVRQNPDKVWNYKDRLSFIFNSESLHEAGKGWAYSDTNYILLGMLIEKITGNYYYDEVRKRILIPNGLQFTYAADRRVFPNLPVGYSKLPEMFRMPEKVVEKGTYVFNPQMEWTGGGFISTTADLCKWADIYYTNPIFSDSLKTKIITPSAYGSNIDKGLSYGMGSFIYDTKYGKAHGHTGFVPGFNSIFAYFPDQNISMALQVNCDYAKEKMELINYLENIMEVIVE